MGTSVRKSAGQVVDNTDVNPNTENDAWNIRRRYLGLVAVWGNPNAGSTTCTRRQNYDVSIRARKFTDATRPYSDGGVGYTVRAPNNGDSILATDYDNARRIIVEGVRATNQLTGSTIAEPSGYSNSGQIISAAHINNMVATIEAIEARFNLANSFWDANDICARGCQISCMTACQTSCQGCNTSQCHNQKCGIH